LCGTIGSRNISSTFISPGMIYKLNLFPSLL
jgi:hypothetical protein